MTELPRTPGTRPGRIEQVTQLFCSSATKISQMLYEWASVGPDQREEELLPGLLYRYCLKTQGGQQVWLNVYYQIETLGGELWDQEARSLIRLSQRKHSALPRIIEGAYAHRQGVAYVVTEAAKHTLAPTGAMPHVASDPVGALLQFTRLAQGLAQIHLQMIVHRNLWPGAIEWVPPPEEGPKNAFSLRLSRFEMSSLVANLTRQVRLRHDQEEANESPPREGATALDDVESQLRKLYLGQGRSALLCTAPEKLRSLAGPDERSGRVVADVGETERSDVWSLGVIGWQWFVRYNPLVKASDRAEIERELDARLSAFDRDDPSGLRTAAETLGPFLRRRCDIRGVPPDLADLLRNMLEEEPRRRISSGGIVHELAVKGASLRLLLAPDAEEPRPMLLGFMPVESKKTIYKWTWITHDPETEEGRLEMKRFLAHELHAGRLAYSPAGFSPYAHIKEPSHERAKYVLIGERAAWFAEPYYATPSPWESEKTAHELLLIKYVIPRGFVASLERESRLRPLPLLECRPVTVGNEDFDELATHPSWKALLDEVRVLDERNKEHVNLERALGFLLELQDVELAARAYPFTCVSPNRQRSATLKHDAEQDRARIHKASSGLLTLYARMRQGSQPRRLEFGDFFRSLGADGDTIKLAIYGDRVHQDSFLGVALLKWERLDADHIQVEATSNLHQFPERGWVRPLEDKGSDPQLRRQREAVRELVKNEVLVDQLLHPVSVTGYRMRWRAAGADLKSPGREVVKDMLATTPFYALHGPPGTGKTTVTARAVEAALRMDPGMRVLVSAQSHFSLDHMANSILKRFEPRRSDADEEGEDEAPQEDKGMQEVAVGSRPPAGKRLRAEAPLAIRVVSEETKDKVLPARVRRCFDDAVVQSMLDRIEARCAEAVSAGVANPKLAEVIQEWGAHARNAQVELLGRVRRGANLVFATCGTATRRNLNCQSEASAFDWVIVEEAAKAWPTELAIPLVRGYRWTLIGDHAQIGAFHAKDVSEVLDACARSDDQALRAHGEARKEYERCFRLFGAMFDGHKPSADQSRRDETGLLSPLGHLTLQFRMRPPIAEVISRSFYKIANPALSPSRDEKLPPKGWLDTHEDAERESLVSRPSVMRNKALVWLDTQGIETCRDEPFWSNEGEAQLVSMLLGRLEPATVFARTEDDVDPVAVLSPYNAQNQLLRKLLFARPEHAKLVHTIDAYQGREAEVVIASMVRCEIRGEHARANLGHLIDPERVNVMFSRARRLLVVIGRFRSFKFSGVPFWRDVCQMVEHGGSVVPARDLLSAFAKGQE